MKQRGRVSSSALEILPAAPIDRAERQKAPHDLTDEETEVWVSIVNHEEADWFSPSTAPLLAQYCRHAVNVRVIAEQKQKATTFGELERFLKAEAEQSKALATLATKLRISQQSTINKRGNKKTNARKLWE